MRQFDYNGWLLQKDEKLGLRETARSYIVHLDGRDLPRVWILRRKNRRGLGRVTWLTACEWAIAQPGVTSWDETSLVVGTHGDADVVRCNHENGTFKVTVLRAEADGQLLSQTIFSEFESRLMVW